MHTILGDFLTDPLLWMSLVIQFLLALGGAGVALAEDWAKKHRWSLLSCFAVFGLLGMGVTAKQATNAAKDATKLTSALGDVETETNETGRLTKLNTELQQRLITQSEMIVFLAEKNAASSARIDQNTRGLRAQILVLSGKRRQGNEWIKLTSRLAGSLRDFARDWQYGEIDGLRKAEYEVLNNRTPVIQGDERRQKEQYFEDKIESADENYRTLLFKLLSDARALQLALLSQISQEAQTAEQKQKDEQESKFLATFWGKHNYAFDYSDCCENLPEVADYLDTLAVRVKAASEE
ncbi:MAG: hypothetical protein WBQ03_24425 [Candidatus Sulfotelmatobacter sp.]